ncbi:hypothetical protein GGS26DRAFT_397747 [Hypomontagnella submonticulosa]|nr:hypothetical protein GGS26DRAFT_397747 [Hypomontagnella submonticulosa]
MNVDKVEAPAQKAAPKFCQRWTVDVLTDLERKSLVPIGTSQTWSRQIEADLYSDDGVLPCLSQTQSGYSVCATTRPNYLPHSYQRRAGYNSSAVILPPGMGFDKR